jgi:murein L,D-transpeptidase YcbB/YkuD
MAYLNGRLPSVVLGNIVGGRLLKDAARTWNAMNAESVRRYGVTLRPSGSRSSYRTYAEQQYFWNLYVSGKGNLAARPGTSNHGWGLAVDLATPQMRHIVDQIGAKYGWSKKWSDAQSEWWHLRWKQGSYPVADADPVLKYRSAGPSVIALKKLLYHKGVRDFSSTPTGQPSSNRYSPFFGTYTVAAVKRFQRSARLGADGVVGARTWAALRR